MRLGWSKSDEPEPAQVREIRRNTGQLLGRLDELLPWANLQLTLDAVTATIHLSDVFDPFHELVEWGREIDEGDLPIAMEIDEEGQEAALAVLRTEDPHRVLLRVMRKYEEEILLEGIVARTALAAALKAEMRRFFTEEFEPQHWDMGRDDDPDDGFIQTKDRVLNHAWLAPAK